MQPQNFHLSIWHQSRNRSFHLAPTQLYQPLAGIGSGAGMGAFAISQLNDCNGSARRMSSRYCKPAAEAFIVRMWHDDEYAP